MNDAEYADKAVEELEEKFRSIYRQARKEIREKLIDFENANALRELEWVEMLKNGEKTLNEFNQWKRTQLYAGKNWENQKKNIAYALKNSNEIANRMINDQSIDVFAYGGNYAAYEFEDGFKVHIGFDLYDRSTVQNLIKNDPKILPPKKLDPIKDVRWNMKNIASQVTLGIIQGESVKQVAKRLASVVTDRNEKQMLLHARTAMTSAHNAGRMARYKEAQALGIEFKKVWLSTHDGRARELHLGLDEQAVKPEEAFEIDGYEIMYPGDPDAEPEMVYNCRCTLVTELDKYPSKYAQSGYGSGESKTYEEWVEESHEELTRGGFKYGEKYTIPVASDTYGTISDHTYTITKEDDYPFPNGTMGGVYQRRSADIYTLEDGTRMVVPSDLDKSNQSKEPEFFIERYYQLPEDFRNQIQKTVHIVDYRNPQDSKWAQRYHMKNFRSYATGGNEITFYAYNDHDPEYVVKTFAHEGGHYIDLWRDGVAPTSESPRWAKAMSDDEKWSGRKGVSSYAEVHKHEDFAESVAAYMTENEKFKSDFPNRYKIIDELIGG